MSWSFSLLGDLQQMKKMLNSPDTAEKSIIKSFENEQYCMQELADHVIAIAGHSYNTLQTLYKIPAKKITLITNGLKDSYKKYSQKEKAAIRRKYHIHKKEKIVIFAGRLDPVKGVGFMIEAFKALAKENPYVRLFIVGDGSLATLMDVANPCWTRITFTGYLQQEQLFELYGIASIGIVPSLHEEFGYVAVEMMMQGLPVVVNNTTGLKEIVEDGVNGSYIHIQTDQNKKEIIKNDICQVLSHLLDDVVMQNKYRETGRKSYLEKYEMNIFKKNMISFYELITKKIKKI
jgi:glycosyltransferase